MTRYGAALGHPELYVGNCTVPVAEYRLPIARRLAPEGLSRILEDGVVETPKDHASLDKDSKKVFYALGPEIQSRGNKQGPTCQILPEVCTS